MSKRKPFTAEQKKKFYPRERMEKIWSAKRGMPAWNKGVKASDEAKEKMKLGWKLKHPKKIAYCLVCNKQLYKSAAKHCKKHSKMGGLNPSYNKPSWRKGKKFPEYSKENHPNWKGGITPINEALRKTFEYEEWRKTVFERDLYTCRACGKVGGELNADHIKRWIDFPELRLDLTNGQTLCKPCHLKKTIIESKSLWKNQYSKGHKAYKAL